MEDKLLWNTPIIKIPDEFVVFTKNNKIKVVKSLTKNNNLKTIKKKKPIKIIEDKNIDNIIIENKGRKVEINNNDLGLKKMLKEKKPRKKKDMIDQKLIDTTNIKKPTIKISEPIITKKEKYYIEPSLNKKENEKLQLDLIDFKKKYITRSRLEEFLLDHNLKPKKLTIDEWDIFNNNFLKNHNFNFGWNK